MQLSTLLMAATLALGIQGQRFAAYSDLNTCLRQPAFGTFIDCPSHTNCVTVGAAGWSSISLKAFRTLYRVEAFQQPNCAGPVTRLSRLDSCAPSVTGSQGFQSYRCTPTV
ncbi:hypothetical protein HJFPF1_07708 [Paramyrothecium foliicola]|nr:hypothetical protein HJFPF1_07708 [Paramyrothecium foliicola]